MFDSVVALIPAFPLFAAIVNGLNALAGHPLSWRTVQRLATGAIFLAFAGSCWVLAGVLSDPAAREVIVYRWLDSGALTVDVAFLIDSLSAVMMLVTTGIGFLVAVFSINYMHNERGFARYFAVMCLFVFAMLVLVMGNSYILLFLGWEAVGVCSYLLIGFYYDRKAAAQAGTQAFVMNRIGDAGFLIGIFFIIDHFGTANYTTVLGGAATLSTSTATAIGLFLLLGAVGKSAQLPLATWLPRAMEGPTPSSALIHAATMVTAGVYMIVRSHAIYDQAPDALLVVAIIGAATALFGSLVGLVQTDIKSLLAYSTTSQLGLMFFACGLGAYTVAIFHMVAHAVFKTLLFLTAPSILHHLHGTAEIRAREPVSDRAPVAFRLFLLGGAALASVPFLASWWDGDIFRRDLGDGLYLLFGLALVAAFTAALATARLVRMSFSHAGHHASGAAAGGVAGRLVKAFAVLVAIIAVGAAVGVLPGGAPGTWFGDLLQPVVTANPGLPPGNVVLRLALFALVILMLAAAWFTPVYLQRLKPEQPGLVMYRPRRLFNLALNRFWLDELYDWAFVRRARRLGEALDRFDTEVLDKIIGVPAPPSRVRASVSVREAAAAEAAAQRWEAPGALGALAKLAGGATGWVEREGVGRATGAIGWLTHALANVFISIEREVINGGEALVAKLTHVIAIASARVEQSVFHTGIHVGVPQASGRVGRFLSQLEGVLGRPAVVASVILLALVAVLVVTL